MIENARPMKTDLAKDMYVKEADSSRLSVSLSLGL